MGVVCFHLLFGPDGPQRVLVVYIICMGLCVCVYACGCLHVGVGACLCVCL